MEDNPYLRDPPIMAVNSFGGDPEYAPRFYGAIGRVVVLWGRFEQAFDAQLLNAVNIAEKHGIEAKMQVSLSRKTDLMRTICSKCEPLQPTAEAASAFTKDVEDAGEARNRLIHSNVIGFIDGPPPKLNLMNIRYRRDLVIRSRLEPTLEEIADFSVHIDRLMIRLMKLTWGWSTILEKLDKDRSQAK